jgi:F-type H+/Na+-transporting ATPase subunit alpha
MSDSEIVILSEAQREALSKNLLENAKLTTSKEDFLNTVVTRVELGDKLDRDPGISELIKTLSTRSQQIKTQVRFTSVGTVHRIGNGVATVSGLPNVSIDEIVTFPTGMEGMALNLDRTHVDLIMLGSEEGIRGGDLVEATGKRLQIPVGSQLLGRVVDPLGRPIDSDDRIEASQHRYLSKIAPGVIQRTPVNQSLFTGTKVIDMLFPIGRGQRELILGDRQTGKTTLAVDAILNQKHSGVRCIYVSIGQKKSSTLSVIETLRKHDVMSHAIVVSSSADDQPALKYLAPYAGMTMAEYFLDQGLDVLIVFDDLSKHADAYRELSLLLRRPPGREAYPGDIFYIHSKLLERACKLNAENGGGSITALPIATTQNGNIAAYITTNLISITDGQLVLDADLFNQNQKPAIDIGRSVSRVGGAAQRPAMRKLVGSLKLELSQYKEVEHFTRFGTEVDETTRRQINKGKRILSILKQEPNKPYSYPMTVVILYVLNQGLFDPIPMHDMGKFERALRSFFTHRENKLLLSIDKEERLSESTISQLNSALSAFNHYWQELKGEIQ